MIVYRSTRDISIGACAGSDTLAGSVAKLKFNLYRFRELVSELEGTRKERKKERDQPPPFEFTYLCFWNTVTCNGLFRSPRTIYPSERSFRSRIARCSKRVDYFKDNWNLIFPGWGIYGPLPPDFYVSVRREMPLEFFKMRLSNRLGWFYSRRTFLQLLVGKKEFFLRCFLLMCFINHHSHYPSRSPLYCLVHPRVRSRSFRLSFGFLIRLLSRASPCSLAEPALRRQNFIKFLSPK